MENEVITKWLEKDAAKLKISKQHFHHHAYEIITTHYSYQNQIISLLSREIQIKTRVKVTKLVKSRGIKADELNNEIRRLLREKSNSNLKFEVNEERGVFYFSSSKGSIGGFDFAYINHERNLYALRNLCFGELQYHDGKSRWTNFLNKNKDLSGLLSDTHYQHIGKDLMYEKKESDPPLIVGEIQFGNWALAYRDFFKVLKANVQNSIDCLIYIVPTGELESMLSDGIVTFDNTIRILDEFSKVISVPVWVIGIDLEF